MNPISTKISGLVMSPKFQKSIKASIKPAEITAIESAKIAATVIAQSLTKNPDITYFPSGKMVGDFIEFAVRFTVGVFKKNPEKNFEKIVFGNPANGMTDSLLLSFGTSKFKTVIKGLFK